ncbi:MAG: ATP-binding protein, partial [Chitinophagaceae bacterium]
RAMFEHGWSSDCQEESILKYGEFPIPVQLSLTVLELEEGISLSIIITNLSVQKKYQQLLKHNNQQLELMNQALETSNHDLQQFASVASHDLQEPLRKIQMFSNILKDNRGSSPEQQEKYISKIIDSAGRMKTLIVDILNYSKLSARDNTFETVDLNQILTELLDDFELLIHETKAEIKVRKLPVIKANYGQIRQVFYNVVSNALKFSRQGSIPVIDIRGRLLTEKSFGSAESEDGQFCLLSVKDNGIGFDEKYLGLIFALFERLHSKDNYEGTGIGLAITKKIVEKHNGLVTATSNAGEGAEFLILLPVNQN